MKKSLFFILFCLCYTQILFAQNSNWENGIVILQNGDSLTGEIKYRNEKIFILDLS
ncbi:hypothetical protein [Taibaiella lutea]|uniref:hypothetical protein n=1 Tax=Taibaiella lutea TaxID=2608001 RepID=UPI001C108CF3|nr:hypothetical protein [Taibaiella lutea]